MTRTLLGKRAVVIGAGMAGLAAAKALTDHFEQVVVLERDHRSPDAGPRPGTPQARHPHGLLAGGQRALEQLFPGFEQDLIRAGAVPIRAGLDFRLEAPGYDPFPQRDLGWVTYGISRPLLESVLRRRLEQQAGVTVLAGHRVLEIVARPDGSEVTGVCCETSGGREETLATDLVVDASGRGVLTLALLKATGCGVPDESTVGVDLGYATMAFIMPDDAPAEWKAVVTQAKIPESSRFGLLFPLEENCWILTVSGRNGEWPSGDREGFMEFVRQLRTPTISNAIANAHPLTDVMRMGFAESVRRHFEQLQNFPRGLLPIGDAVCRFNPIYGQGMSVAAQEACVLQRLLCAARTGDFRAKLRRRYFAEIQPLIEAPWTTAAVPDFTFPDTRGRRPADLENTLKFRHALFDLAARDPEVHKLFLEVQHLLRPLSAYQDSGLVQRVTAAMAAA